MIRIKMERSWECLIVSFFEGEFGGHPLTHDVTGAKTGSKFDPFAKCLVSREPLDLKQRPRRQRVCFDPRNRFLCNMALKGHIVTLNWH